MVASWKIGWCSWFLVGPIFLSVWLFTGSMTDKVCPTNRRRVALGRSFVGCHRLVIKRCDTKIMAVTALYAVEVTLSNFNNLPYMQNDVAAFQSRLAGSGRSQMFIASGAVDVWRSMGARQKHSAPPERRV